MEVRFEETEYKKAEITAEESIRVAIKALRVEFDIPEHSYLQGGGEDENTVLMKHVEYSGGSHSWDTKECHRVSHEDDATVIRAIELLNEAANAHRDRR